MWVCVLIYVKWLELAHFLPATTSISIAIQPHVNEYQNVFSNAFVKTSFYTIIVNDFFVLWCTPLKLGFVFFIVVVFFLSIVYKSNGKQFFKLF